MKRFCAATALLLQLTLLSAVASAQTHEVGAPPGHAPSILDHRIDPRLISVATTDAAFGRRTDVRSPSLLPPQEPKTHRLRNAIIGGVIGAGAGVAVCTGISSLTNDSAKGSSSTCTAKGNILFGVGGFAVGAAVGSLVR